MLCGFVCGCVMGRGFVCDCVFVWVCVFVCLCVFVCVITNANTIWLFIHITSLGCMQRHVRMGVCVCVCVCVCVGVCECACVNVCVCVAAAFICLNRKRGFGACILSIVFLRAHCSQGNADSCQSRIV